MSAASPLHFHEPSPGPLVEGAIVAGKYRLGPALGAGGMGVVHVAEHLGLGERVALKFLHAQYADNEQIVERFLREARAQFRIKSDHVVRVLDVGAEGGAPYFAMELLDGASLADVCEVTPRVSVAVACELVRQACEALESAHALGIVHRDVKPANLMVCPTTGGTARVKLLDFGIAQIARVDGLSRLTMTETVIGTPLYMAPEQMRSARATDPRSDVWSVGVVLYRLLTGSLPFFGESLADLVYLQHHAPAPRVDTLVEGIPSDVADAVARCLSVAPADRFGSAAALAAALAPHARPIAASELFVPALATKTVVMATPPPASSPPFLPTEAQGAGLTFVRRKVHDTSGSTAFAVHELALRDERKMTTGPRQNDAAPSRTALVTPALVAGGVLAGLVLAVALVVAVAWARRPAAAPIGLNASGVLALPATTAVAATSAILPVASAAPAVAPAREPAAAAIVPTPVVSAATPAPAKRQPSGPGARPDSSIYTEKW